MRSLDSEPRHLDDDILWGFGKEIDAHFDEIKNHDIRTAPPVDASLPESADILPPFKGVKSLVHTTGLAETFTARFDEGQAVLLLTGNSTGIQLPIHLTRYASYYKPLYTLGGEIKYDIFINGNSVALTLKNNNGLLEVALHYTPPQKPTLATPKATPKQDTKQQPTQPTSPPEKKKPSLPPTKSAPKEHTEDPIQDDILTIDPPLSFKNKKVEKYFSRLFLIQKEHQENVRVRYVPGGLFVFQYLSIPRTNYRRNITTFKLQDLENGTVDAKPLVGGVMGVGGEMIGGSIKAVLEDGVLRFYRGIDDVVSDNDLGKDKETKEYAYDRSPLTFPVKGSVQSVDYKHNHSNNRGRAVDIDSTPQSDVVAVDNGTIVYVDDGEQNNVVRPGVRGRGYGNEVFIRHANNTYSRYAHLSPGISPAVGDQITSGQTIAKVGNTGHVRAGVGGGYHLHFELRKPKNDRQPVYDPKRDGDFSARSGKYLQKMHVNTYIKKKPKVAPSSSSKPEANQETQASTLTPSEKLSSRVKQRTKNRTCKKELKDSYSLYFRDYRNDTTVPTDASHDRIVLEVKKAKNIGGILTRTQDIYGQNWTIMINPQGEVLYTQTEERPFQIGSASYHPDFSSVGYDGNKTYVAAHNFFPIGSSVAVSGAGKTIMVKIVSRGPFVSVSEKEAQRLQLDRKTAPFRIIDLSAAAAKKLGLTDAAGNPDNTTKVKVELLQ